MGDRAVLRTGRARLLPRRQEGLRADRIRGAHRPGRPPGRGAGVRGQHRRPGRVHPDRAGDQEQARHRATGAGRRPRHDHRRPHRQAPRTGRQTRRRSVFRLDHRAACPRKRQDLLQATDKELAHIGERVGKGTLSGADKIGIAVGKVSGKFKVGKHFHLTITDAEFTYHRDQAAIDAEAALDGIYVLRTSVDADALDPAAVVEGYKKLANVERDFRIIKSDDLDLRPIHHHLDDRVKAHVLICMLACYLVWHLRKAWAPLTFTDETPPHRDNPVAPARRSTAAQAKASTKHDADGNPVRTFGDLLDHLATLTRDRIRYHDTDIEIDKLTAPPPQQRRPFDLPNTPTQLTPTA